MRFCGQHQLFRGGARAPLSVVIGYITGHKDTFGVEPICRTLKEAGIKIASSTYYACIAHTPSNREVRDRILMDYLQRLFTQNFYVYGARKLYALINQDHHLATHGQGPVAGCTVERLMKRAHIQGLMRKKSLDTTYSAKRDNCPKDLFNRWFKADAPNVLWGADFTYVRTLSGRIYTAFITDVYSRRIVGWKLSDTMYTEPAVDALNMAIADRLRQDQRVDQLIHHSDRGVQYRAIAYGATLDDNQIVASVGSKGDSYDNALSEAINSFYKGECIHNVSIHPKGFATLDEVEKATANWVGWYNNHRLHSALGHTSPSTTGPPTGTQSPPRTQPPDPTQNQKNYALENSGLDRVRAGETMKTRGSCTGRGAAKAGAVARVAAVSTARATAPVVVRRRVVEA